MCICISPWNPSSLTVFFVLTMTPTSLTCEIALSAARLVVEEGMEYGPAKRRAARLVAPRTPRSVQLPTNQHLDMEVFSYLAIFCADTQPQELHALRLVALHWMVELQAFRPHLTGAVWRGTATRLNSVHLQLFCDDTKEAEMALLNQRIAFDIGSAPSPWGDEIDVLTVCSPSPALQETVTVHLSILNFDDLRGALKPGPDGQSERGDLARLRKRMAVNP
jgi:hypothetical protein